jgi:hypothetical protein
LRDEKALEPPGHFLLSLPSGTVKQITLPGGFLFREHLNELRGARTLIFDRRLNRSPRRDSNFNHAPLYSVLM